MNFELTVNEDVKDKTVFKNAGNGLNIPPIQTSVPHSLQILQLPLDSLRENRKTSFHLTDHFSDIKSEDDDYNASSISAPTKR